MRYFAIIILNSLIINLNVYGQKMITDNSDFFYQISPIYDFKLGIVSITFDDGYITQFSVALPLLKERNLPATFYVITNKIDSTTKSIISEDISGDYEIGSHTLSHPDLVKIGNVKAKEELLNSQLYLRNTFGKESGLTLSYPMGLYNISVKQLAANFYLAAKSSDIGYNSTVILDRFALKTQDYNEETKNSKANSWVDFAIKNHLWLVETIHGVDGKGFSPVDSKVFKEHLDYIKTVVDQVWCSTVSNVIKYIVESKETYIECVNCNDTIYNIRINDFMDDSIYNQPLSIKIKIPDKWDNIWISGINKHEIEYYNKNKFVLFNALPDNRLITIRPGSKSAPGQDSEIRFVYLSANPFLDDIRFTLEVSDKADIEVLLCNINGKILIHQEEKSVNGIINIFFETSGIGKGLYFLKVKINGVENIIKKLVKI